ncbi:MAG: hypothetical protein ACKVQS_06590 [Fimbriimonadaceae bacterium]
MGTLRLHRAIICATALISITPFANADFFDEVTAQMNNIYGNFSGMKESESFLTPIKVGEIRTFKREGGSIIPMQRNPNDYRTAEIQADPLSWTNNFPPLKKESILTNLVRTTSYGSGRIAFNRRNTNERKLIGILKSITKLLNVDLSTTKETDLELVVSWDNLELNEFMPHFLSQVTSELKNQGKNPYEYMKGVNSTHESWIVLKTLTLKDLNIEITNDKPATGHNVEVANVVRFSRSNDTSGTYSVTLDSPSTIASYAVNISRGDIYKNAGLKMPSN